jgi:hypothetical protein
MLNLGLRIRRTHRSFAKWTTSRYLVQLAQLSHFLAWQRPRNARFAEVDSNMIHVKIGAVRRSPESKS